MRTSQTRKEEAELRQIAKKARLARKESKARTRNSKLKQARLKQKTSTSNTNDNNSPHNSNVKLNEINKLVQESTIVSNTSSNHTRQRRGAIILPEEVKEMKVRLQLYDDNVVHANKNEKEDKRSNNNKNNNTANCISTNSVGLRKGKEQKMKSQTSLQLEHVASTKRKNTVGESNFMNNSVNVTNNKRNVTVNNESSIRDKKTKTTKKNLKSNNALTCIDDNDDNVEVPNYHMEIHFKRKQVLVDVILHHVPFNKISLNESNSRVLVVDTREHTKKYRLELNMPEDVEVNIDTATFEWEAGVLKCVLPIKNETLPSTLQTEWEMLRDKMQKDKRLRFRLREEGGLTMRSRQAVLKLESKKEKVEDKCINAKATDLQSARYKNELVDNELENEEITLKEEEEERREDVKSKQTSKNSKRLLKVATNKNNHCDFEGSEQNQRNQNEYGIHTRTTKSESNIATEANNTVVDNNTNNNNVNTKSKADVFALERATALAIATAAAARAKQTIREKVQLAKEVQRRRQARLETRSSRKEVKDAKRQESFARVLEEQKQQLLARAALQASVQEEIESKQTVRKYKSKEKSADNIKNNNNNNNYNNSKSKQKVHTEEMISANEASRAKKRVRFAEEENWVVELNN